MRREWIRDFLRGSAAAVCGVIVVVVAGVVVMVAAVVVVVVVVGVGVVDSGIKHKHFIGFLMDTNYL